MSCVCKKELIDYCRGKCMDEGYHTLGRSGESPRLFKEQMEAAGFINVTEVIYKWPQNSKWPKDKKYKELGRFSLIMSIFKIKRSLLMRPNLKECGHWQTLSLVSKV